MKNILAKSALVLALSFFVAQQASAFVLIVSAIAPANAPTNRQKALIVGIFFLTHPVNGIAMLLDDKANAYEITAKKFQEAGAPQEEAEDLAIVIVNSAMKSGGKDVIIPAEVVEAAAPTFSKSENFTALLNQKI